MWINQFNSSLFIFCEYIPPATHTHAFEALEAKLQRNPQLCAVRQTGLSQVAVKGS